MKSYIPIIIAACSVLFISCKETGELFGNNDDLMPITINANNKELLTRASILTSVPDFTVYAYDESGKPIINGGKFNADGTSKDGKIYYWPVSGNVTFYAYAPDNKTCVTWDEAAKTLTYNADADAANQQDVIYATTTQSKTSDGKVTLSFRHAAAGLAVKWSTVSDLPSNINVSVSEIKICNLFNTGNLTFSSDMSASGKKTVFNLGLDGLMMVSPQTITTWNADPAKPEKIENTTKAYMSVKCRVKVDDKYLVGTDTEDGVLYYPISTENIEANKISTLNLTMGTKRFDATRIFGYDSNGKAVRYVPPYEDLGLSVKWATCNLDADLPEESGKYYAWGTTVGYEPGTHEWSRENYPLYDKNTGKYIKYNTLNPILERQDDAASVNLGLSYHIPTMDEIKELKEKCKFERAWNYGVFGTKITGPNGNSIFFPKYQFEPHASEPEYGSYVILSSNSSFLEYYGYYKVDGVFFNMPSSSSISVSYIRNAFSGIMSFMGNIIRPVYKEVPTISIGSGTTIPEDSQAKPHIK